MLKPAFLAALCALGVGSMAPSVAADAPRHKVKVAPAAPAVAAVLTVAAVPKLPVVLAMLQGQGGMTVLKSFKAAGGLTGWVVHAEHSGETTIVYTSPDGEVLLAGLLLDKTGHNLTNIYVAEHVPKQDYSPAYQAFAADKDSAGVWVGSAKAIATLTVVMDANCGYCKLMHRLVQPAVDAGELRIRYVPVAILGADSVNKGAGLLASKDAALALASLSSGGSAESSEDPALLAKVRSNTQLLQKHGFTGTPVVFYNTGTASSSTLTVSNGLPSILPMFKALGISGQVDKLKADATLAQYLR